MKKVIAIIICILICLIQNVAAYSHMKTHIDFEDGMIVETIIEESNIVMYSTKTKTGTKTKNYKDSRGNTLYSVKLTGNFSYTGTTAKCISSSLEATSYHKTWKVFSKSSSKNKNTAAGKVVMKQYYDGEAIQTKNVSITLTCSNTGVLS